MRATNLFQPGRGYLRPPSLASHGTPTGTGSLFHPARPEQSRRAFLFLETAMNASNHTEQVAVLRRELETRIDIIDRLQTKNRIMQNELATHRKSTPPEADLIHYEYKHVEMLWLDTFVYAPKGIDFEDLEVRAVYLRGIDITDRMTRDELDAIALAYAKQDVDANV